MIGWNDSRGIFDSTCLYEIISYECDISYVHITMEPVYNTLMDTKKINAWQRKLAYGVE